MTRDRKGLPADRASMHASEAHSHAVTSVRRKCVTSPPESAHLAAIRRQATAPIVTVDSMGRRQTGALPLISTRANGDRLVGHRLPLARDLYDAGTPPVWGLAKRPEPSDRVSSIQVGDRLRVSQVGRHWVVSDAVGKLGWLRWRAATHGKSHPVTGRTVRLPANGVLHVQSLLISLQGDVRDFGGYVGSSG